MFRSLHRGPYLTSFRKALLLSRSREDLTVPLGSLVGIGWQTPTSIAQSAPFSHLGRRMSASRFRSAIDDCSSLCGRPQLWRQRLMNCWMPRCLCQSLFLPQQTKWSPNGSSASSQLSGHGMPAHGSGIRGIPRCHFNSMRYAGGSNDSPSAREGLAAIHADENGPVWWDS